MISVFPYIFFNIFYDFRSIIKFLGNISLHDYVLGSNLTPLSWRDNTTSKMLVACILWHNLASYLNLEYSWPRFELWDCIWSSKALPVIISEHSWVWPSTLLQFTRHPLYHNSFVVNSTLCSEYKYWLLFNFFHALLLYILLINEISQYIFWFILPSELFCFTCTLSFSSLLYKIL